MISNALGRFEITSPITPELYDARSYYQLIVSIAKWENHSLGLVINVKAVSGQRSEVMYQFKAKNQLKLKLDPIFLSRELVFKATSAKLNTPDETFSWLAQNVLVQQLNHTTTYLTMGDRYHQKYNNVK